MPEVQQHIQKFNSKEPGSPPPVEQYEGPGKELEYSVRPMTERDYLELGISPLEVGGSASVEVTPAPQDPEDLADKIADIEAQLQIASTANAEASQAFRAKFMPDGDNGLRTVINFNLARWQNKLHDWFPSIPKSAWERTLEQNRQGAAATGALREQLRELKTQRNSMQQKSDLQETLKRIREQATSS